MDREEFFRLFGRGEWNNFEVKKCQRGVSPDTYTTVSAFANTKGGWIVLGIKDNNGELEIVGVLEVDKVQNDFLATLRSCSKFSQEIPSEEDIIEYENKKLLTFYVPELPRNKKPVYLNGDWRECYIRRGAGDQKCNEEEIRRFIRDSSDVNYDGEPIDLMNYEQFFDEKSVRYYRNRYSSKNSGRYETLNDEEFLIELGFIIENNGKYSPTRAAILIFGKDRYIRQILNNRIVVDYFRIDQNYDNWSSDQRWNDRVAIEGNLIQAWITLSEKYYSITERPFTVDIDTLRRHDDPPDYISFREAAINLLIHQDFGDHSRKPSIKFFKDRTIFWNPGDSYADEKELLETREKEVRNPSIVSAFRRIGLSDQAGTGVSSIFSNWREIGNLPPIINNCKDQKTFELILLKEQLLTEEQILFQTGIGVHLSNEAALVFALACRNTRISLTNVRGLIGRNWDFCNQIIQELEKEVLIYNVGEELYEIDEHLKEFPSIANIGSGTSLTSEKSSLSASINSKSHIHSNISNIPKSELTDFEYKILSLCEIQRTLLELLDACKYKNRRYFKKSFLNPLINNNLIKMTYPDKPQSPNQKYLVTDGGLKLLQLKKRD